MNATPAIYVRILTVKQKALRKSGTDQGCSFKAGKIQMKFVY